MLWPALKNDLIAVRKFVIGWLLLVTISLAANFTISKEQTLEFATDRAATIASLINLVRNWSTQHGGVYVPITEATPPNPYLNIPNRDVKTVDGQRLTLVDPAYLIRQLATLALPEPDISVAFHLTSLNPIRPGNAADDWEREALECFKDSDEPYVAEMVESDSGTLFRYIMPLTVKKDCLKCHQKHGYKEREIRGGISVTLPADRLLKLELDRFYPIILMHLIIFAIGVTFLFYFERYNRSRGDAELAFIDALTGINNRRSFEKQLKVEWLRAKRRNEPLSIIMVDIDYFKNYNDTYGHQMGDQCLADVASLLQGVLMRPSDILARYGGEEFVAILSADSEGALVIGNKMQAAVESAGIENSGSSVNSDLTISVGVSTDYPSKELYADELIARADKALYKAKSQGRNRVVYLSN